jgi:hypothetical protein
MMAWIDVCKRGKPANTGTVRQDDVKSTDPAKLHDATAPSPGILKFVNDVVRGYTVHRPAKPFAHRLSVAVQTYPGRSAADVHFEGRAADVFFSYNNPVERVFGDWLFDYCVINCRRHQIQGVIFGDREWFSEKNRGAIGVRRDGQAHYSHVHVELNGDGAALAP